jgi:hypothetical protein
LNETQTDRQEDVSAKKQDEQRRPPDQVIGPFEPGFDGFGPEGNLFDGHAASRVAVVSE